MSTSASDGPFHLLRSLEAAERVLLLSYTTSLDFFERRALGAARDLQAATTVISDATRVSSDPLASSGAGVRYLDCRAVCPRGAAFHPKLVVIAGRDEGVVAIGSGNLTFAGWHDNEELWTVLRATREQGPVTIAQLARFLRALAVGPVQLSPGAPDALLEVGDLLDGLSTELPGPTLVSTLGGAIVDELPVGPVERLEVYAPFYDSGLVGMQAVVDRLRPESLTVYAQRMTSVDGALLQRFLDEYGGTLAWCADDRYRHGKLLEWTVEGERYALTGSPNISRRALLGAVGEGGNLELGLIGSTRVSVVPPAVAAPQPGAAVLDLRRDEREDHPAATVLLAAVLAPTAEVVLHLAQPLEVDVRLQAHDAQRDWTTVPGATLAAGDREYRVPSLGLPAGRQVRLQAVEWASNAVSVLDLVKATKRPLKRIGKAIGTPVEVFECGRMNELFEDALALAHALRHQGFGASRPSAAGGDGESGEPVERELVVPTLADYIDARAAVVDEATMQWALVLPSLPAVGGAELDWQVGELTTERDEDVDDDDANEPPPVRPDDLQAAIKRVGAHRRRQLKGFCERLVEDGGSWPSAMRLRGARYLLNAVAADLWPDPDAAGEKLVGLARLLSTATDAPTDDDLAAAGSYAAIALALLRADVRKLSVNDASTLRFTAAVDSVRPLLEYVDAARLERLADDLHDSYGELLDPERVLALMQDVRQRAGGAALAVRLLADDEGIRARVTADGGIELGDPIPTMAVEWTLVRALGLADVDGPIEARGRTERLDCRAVWHKPWLAIERCGRGGTFGGLYEIRHPSLRALATSWRAHEPMSDWLPRAEETWMRGDVPPQAAALLGGYL